MAAQVKWYGPKVLKLLNQSLNQAQDRIARRLAENTQQNIIDNNQVRTGFLGASVYVVSASGSTYDRTWEPGEYFDIKAGEMASRDKAPEVEPAKGNALMGVAADYAMDPEMDNSFAFRSVDQVAGEVAGILSDVARELS
jgi:hypothetical protein